MKLTIIIPTREQISSVVECVAALELNDAEIIVIDDASPCSNMSKRLCKKVGFRPDSCVTHSPC
jgi:hypothetical protein